MTLHICSWLLLLVFLCFCTVPTVSLTVKPASPAATIKPWQFQGHDVYAEVINTKTITNKPAILLIHGFGCSTTYWRETVSTLTQNGYEVHALDLLGQGQSAKPGRAQGIEYSISLWAAQCSEYMQENIKKKDIVLLGNSLGSLVALSAATGDYALDDGTATDKTISISELQKRIKGIGMFNCGIGLNSSGIVKEPQWNPLQRFLIRLVFSTMNALLFDNPPVLEYVLRNIVTREFLRNALQSLYIQNPNRVDDALVESFYEPAQDEGAVEALSQIYTNDPGATPMDMHDRHADCLQTLPIHLVWGEVDVVTPIGGGVGSYYIDLAEKDDTLVSLVRIPECGHIPFDDCHVESNQAMLEWLETIAT